MAGPPKQGPLGPGPGPTWARGPFGVLARPGRRLPGRAGFQNPLNTGVARPGRRLPGHFGNISRGRPTRQTSARSGGYPKWGPGPSRRGGDIIIQNKHVVIGDIIIPSKHVVIGPIISLSKHVVIGPIIIQNKSFWA